MKKFGKMLSGKGTIFNDTPSSEEEARDYANALSSGADSNYPVGLSECFCVGISGGCGLDCFVYLKGECHEPEEFYENKVKTPEDRELFKELYPDSIYSKEKEPCKCCLDSKLMECTYCDGTGIMDYNGTPCSKCDGQGMLVCSNCSEDSEDA